MEQYAHVSQYQHHPMEGIYADARPPGYGYVELAAQEQHSAQNHHWQAAEPSPGQPQDQKGPPVARSGRRQHVFRFWRWEMAALVLAAGLVGAMYGILAHFNNREVPRWPVSINLNTLVSLFATVFRAATLAAVAEVIGQLKWTWFRRPRSLLDLQRFDQASRGAYGSLLLLFQAPGDALGVLAAVLMIASLATGPFAQQAVRAVPCEQLVPDVNASVPVANLFQVGYARRGAGQFDVVYDIKGAFVNGLTNPLGNDSAVAVACPTGNCTFSEHGGVAYSSIGLCSRCVDTSGAIGTEPADYRTNRFVLPPGLQLHTASEGGPNVQVGPGGNMSWAAGHLTPEFEAVSTYALKNLSVLAYTGAPCGDSPGLRGCSNNIRTPKGEGMRPLAVSCTVYPCLKHFRGSVAQGRLREELVSTVPAVKSSPRLTVEPYSVAKQPCLVGGAAYDASNFSLLDDGRRAFGWAVAGGRNVSAPYECLYQLGGVLGFAMGSFMDAMPNGSCEALYNSPAALHCGNSFWLESLFVGGRANLSLVSDVIDKFAAVVTNHMRTAGTSMFVDDVGRGPKAPAVGAVYQTAVCTQFSWPWLLLPTVLLALSVVLLALMMARNRADAEQPVWKSSILPFLFHGCAYPTQSTGPLDQDQLEKTAKGLEYQFQTGNRPGQAAPGFVRSSAAADPPGSELDALIAGR